MSEKALANGTRVDMRTQARLPTLAANLLVLSGLALPSNVAGSEPQALATARPKPGPTLSSDGWTLTAEVECGNADRIVRIAKNHFALAPREDPVPIEVQKTGPISNYALYVAIANTRAQRRKIRLDVMIPAWLTKEGFDYFLRKHYMVRPVDSLEWAPIPADDQRDGQDRVYLSIAFSPNERKVISTTAVYPYSQAVAKLRQLAKASAGRHAWSKSAARLKTAPF